MSGLALPDSDSPYPRPLHYFSYWQDHTPDKKQVEGGGVILTDSLRKNQAGHMTTTDPEAESKQEVGLGYKDPKASP